MRSPRIVHAVMGVVLVVMLLPRGAHRHLITMEERPDVPSNIQGSRVVVHDGTMDESKQPVGHRAALLDDADNRLPLDDGSMELVDLALHDPTSAHNVWWLMERRPIRGAGSNWASVVGMGGGGDSGSRLSDGNRTTLLRRRRRPLCDDAVPLDGADASATLGRPATCEWNVAAVQPSKLRRPHLPADVLMEPEVPPYVVKMRRVWSGMRKAPHDPFVPLGLADTNAPRNVLHVQSVALDVLARSTAMHKAVAVFDVGKLLALAARAEAAQQRVVARANLSMGSKAVLAWGHHLHVATVTAGYGSWLVHPSQCLCVMGSVPLPSAPANAPAQMVGAATSEHPAPPCGTTPSRTVRTIVFFGHSHQRLFAAMLCMMWNLTSCHAFRKMLPVAHGDDDQHTASGANGTTAVVVGDDVATWRLDGGPNGVSTAPPNVVLAFVKSVFDLRDRMPAIDTLLRRVVHQHNQRQHGGGPSDVLQPPLVPDLVVYGRGPWDLVFTDTPMRRFMEAMEHGLLAMRNALPSPQTAIVVYLLHATQPEQRGGPRATRLTTARNASSTEPTWQWVLRNVCLGRYRTMQLRTATLCAIKRAVAHDSNNGSHSLLARLRVFDVLAETSALSSHLTGRFVDFGGHHYLDVVLETLVAKFLRQHVCPYRNGCDAFGVCRTHREVLEGYLHSVSDASCAAFHSAPERREPRCARHQGIDA